MFGSMVIDVAIGLALVYSFLAVIASAVSEAISSMLSMRAKTLETAVERLLGNPELAKNVYANPLIRGLAKNDKSAPSYIPAETFALALVQELGKDMARMQQAQQGQAQGAPPGVATFSAGQGQQGWQIIDFLRAAVYNRGASSGLQMLLADAGITDIKAAKKAIESWFDTGMDRAGGWYKRKAQVAIILVSLGVTMALNVDSFRIAKAISQNATLRESIVASYTNTAKSMSAAEAVQPTAARVVQIQQELARMQIPIGWEIWPDKGYSIKEGILISLPGWLVTAMAASLGAPFWFDLLNKLVNLRVGGKPPEPSKKESDEKAPGQA